MRQGGKQETGNRKQETGNRKQETGNRKQETGKCIAQRVLRNAYKEVMLLSSINKTRSALNHLVNIIQASQRLSRSNHKIAIWIKAASKAG